LSSSSKLRCSSCSGSWLRLAPEATSINLHRRKQHRRVNCLRGCALLKIQQHHNAITADSNDKTEGLLETYVKVSYTSPAACWCANQSCILVGCCVLWLDSW
jgi:hypothetical protein